MNTYIKKSSIETIRVYDEEISESFEYRKQIKLLGITFQKEGFYKYKWFTMSPIRYEFISNEEILNSNLLIIDKKVYYKPYVKFENVGNIYFKDTETRDEYIKELLLQLGDNNYIKL